MRAIICRKPGSPDVLMLEEIEKPVVPDDGVLVRVHSASLNPADFFALSGIARMFRGSKGEVLGRDFAGTVESVGKSVTQFQPGDEVFGAARGAFAEYVCIRENGAVVRKPASVTFEQAAAAPIAAITALQAVRDHGRIQTGQRVLINGASGGVGTFAVQIAKSLGADVTGVCSARNVEIVRSIGAGRAIDYVQEDFTQSGQRYDLLIDIAGNRSWSECKRVLGPRATFVAVGGSAHTVSGGGQTVRHFAGVRLASVGGRRKVVVFIAKLKQEGLMVLQQLLGAGRITPVIDRRYELSDVPDAFRYMAQGHARGKLVINVIAD